MESQHLHVRQRCARDGAQRLLHRLAELPLRLLMLPLLLLLALLFGSCRGPGTPPVAFGLGTAPGALAALVPGTDLLVRPLPSLPVDESALFGIDALLIGGQGWRVPSLPGGTDLLPVQRFVERGGRVLLLGYALALARTLGLEERAPDVIEPFRWGFDDRTALGHARLGFQLVSGRAPDLVAGMQCADRREHGYWLLSGAPVSAPLCLYAAGPPARGEVLGTLLAQRDGSDEVLEAAVLVRWKLGRGEVIGLGLEPDLDAVDPAVAQNASAFLKQSLQWLGRDAPRRRVGCWLLPDPTPQPLTALPPVAARDVPGAQPLAHWGWVAAVHAPQRVPELVVDEVLLPGFAAGADVLALDLVDARQGLPLPWGETDPLARPKDYLGSAFARGWSGDAPPRLVQEAHARGVLVQAILDPPPGGSGAAARLAALRFLARQWCDRRRLHDGALDGIALRQWFPDQGGLAVAMLQDFQPGGHVVRMGEGLPLLGGAAAALDARDGRPAGLTAFGLANGFRTGFPGDTHAVGYLDCTALRPPRPSAGADGGELAAGGGSFGDWIAMQAAEFVRERRGRGGAMLWRSHSDATLGADTVAYVHGVSSEPLVAAVAARCTATGTDGWRDAQRALLPAVQPGFGAALAAPAATVLLANNHLRLLGSGGALDFDTGGLARFLGEGSVRLADVFLRTRFFGGRPDADELRTAAVDLLAGGRRPEGGYARAFGDVEGSAVPAVLAFDAAPRWPQRLDLPLGSDLGRFELQLQAHAASGQGVLAVSVDDAVLAILPFQDGRLSIDRTLPLHLAVPRHRTLRLECLDGGAVALDRLQLERAGDVAAEADVAVPAGSLAVVRERSASTYHRETVALHTLADFPGLLLAADCEHAVRGLQQERRFGLLQHRTLLATTAGEGSRDLRRPFVLAAADPALPDLAVVPLQLARYEYFRLDGSELVLKNQPEPGTHSRVGFLFLPRGTASSALPHLTAVFAAIDRPLTLDLGDQGTADLRSDLPLPWTRLVAVRQPARTPFLVREKGWWTWRAAQPGADGNDWLRVQQLPGDVVQIVGGQALLARTRPGPGALHTVALRDPSATSVTVRVLQSSPLATPSVTMGGDFDEVFLDDKPWACFDGRTIALPNRAGTWKVATRRHGGPPAPHVVATRAVLEHCAFDPARHELVLVALPDSSRPSQLPFTALLAGRTPVSIEGGELVAEDELRHASAATRAAAVGGGVVIRFRPGIVRVRYRP